MLKRLTVLILVSCFSLAAFSQDRGNPSPSLTSYLNELPSEQNSFVVKVVHQEILQHLKNILYINPSADNNLLARRPIQQSRARFGQYYQRLVQDLQGQNQEPFAAYSEIKKIRISTERMVFHAIASDPDSIFYGIPDDVYDELFAESDLPIPGFNQLTYEPLIQSSNATLFVVPLAAVSLALVHRFILPLRGGRLLFSVGASVAALLALSGCSGPNVVEFYQSQPQSAYDDVVTIESLWKHIRENVSDHAENVDKTVKYLVETHQTIFNKNEPFNQSMYRQLYASFYATVVGFIRPYLLDEDYQELQDLIFLRNYNLNDVRLNRDLEIRYDLFTKPISEFFSSLQVNVIWTAFSAFVNKYVLGSNLRNTLTQGDHELKRNIINVLYALYKDYEVTWNLNEFMVAQIKARFERNNLTFHSDQMQYRLDWQAVQSFIEAFDGWIQEAEERLEDENLDQDLEGEGDTEDENTQELEYSIPFSFPDLNEVTLPDEESFERSYFTRPTYERQAQITYRSSGIAEMVSFLRVLLGTAGR